MVDTTPTPEFAGLIFPFIMSMMFGVVAHFLAKEKGRNVALWTVVGLIPLVNFIAMWFFVGAANLRLEKKLDAILERQSRLGSDLDS